MTSEFKSQCVDSSFIHQMTMDSLNYKEGEQSKGVGLVSALVGTLFLDIPNMSKTLPEALMVQLLLPQPALHLHWISEFPECISK